MNLINIGNSGRELFLFERIAGVQKVTSVKDFYPYYYVPHEDGEYKSMFGDKLKKILCSDPNQMRKQISTDTFEGDLYFTKRYLIDKIDVIEETEPKVFFIDIEIQTPEVPSFLNPIYPITSISVYNNLDDELVTFAADVSKEKINFKAEEKILLSDFIKYICVNKPDLILIWNASFDYPYLYERAKRVFGKTFNFSCEISPVYKDRSSEWGDLIKQEERENLYQISFPIGISIIDMLQWFKKFTLNKRASYALDYIAQVDLGEQSVGEFKFNKFCQEIIDKNINDVNRMMKLNDKYNLIGYFDQLRRMSIVEWEDLYHASRIIDNLLLKEAKAKGVCLPSKEQSVVENYEGAFREAFKTGRFFDIGKADLTSAYPSVLKEFCLDPSNVTDKFDKNIIPITIYNLKRDEDDKLILDDNGQVETIQGETYNFIQDNTKLVPTIVMKLLEQKNNLKNELKQLNPNSEEYENLKLKYDAIKAIVNSAYGTLANKFFRLYDKRVAETITFLVREVLAYTIKRLKEEHNIDVIYCDTDSVLMNTKEPLTESLNKYIQEWAKKYGKDSIDLQYDWEGIFTAIFIIAKCRYKGRLLTKKGLTDETKGIETKRADSSIYIKKFQDKLIEKILDNETEADIKSWVNNEKQNFKNQSIVDIAFPGRMSKEVKEYKNLPIWVRALQASNLNKHIGERFYWVYIKPKSIGKQKVLYYTFNDIVLSNTTAEKMLENANNGKSCSYRKKEYSAKEIKQNIIIKEKEKEVTTDVWAFDLDNVNSIPEIDWDKMKERNIENKIETIFKSMHWENIGQESIDKNINDVNHMMKWFIKKG